MRLACLEGMWGGKERTYGEGGGDGRSTPARVHELGEGRCPPMKLITYQALLSNPQNVARAQSARGELHRIGCPPGRRAGGAGAGGGARAGGAPAGRGPRRGGWGGARSCWGGRRPPPRSVSSEGRLSPGCKPQSSRTSRRYGDA